MSVIRHGTALVVDRNPSRVITGGWRGGGKGVMPLPELGPNKFQERLYGGSRMQENLLAAGAPPRTPMRSLQRSSRPPSWWEGGWLPPFQEPHPRSQPFGALASNVK